MAFCILALLNVITGRGETINENENEGPGALAVCWEPCVGGSLDFVFFFDEISETTLMD